MLRALYRASQLDAADGNIREQLNMYRNLKATYATLRSTYKDLFRMLDAASDALTLEASREIPYAPADTENRGLQTPGATRLLQSASPTQLQTVDPVGPDGTPIEFPFDPSTYNRAVSIDLQALQNDTSLQAESFKFVFLVLLSTMHNAHSEEHHLDPQRLFQ